METVRKAIDVQASPESVFSQLKGSSGRAAFMPHLTHVRTIEEHPHGECVCTYSGRILGFPVAGELQTVDCQKNERVVWRLEGDLSGTVRWYLQSVSPSTKTRCTIAVTYQSVGPAILRSVLNRVLHARTNRHVAAILKRVKHDAETPSRPERNV